MICTAKVGQIYGETNFYIKEKEIQHKILARIQNIC